MTISVSFFGQQRSIVGADELDVALTPGAVVADVLSYVRQLYPLLNVNAKNVLITVNGQACSPAQVLKTHDRVAFLPHLGGG
jgi:molybdopterin converting factor small subunit